MRKVFVVGCPRSGTTLVQALLARHPDVFSLRETYFFEALLGDAQLRWGDREARPTRRWYHRAGLAQSWGRRRLRELEELHCVPARRRPLPRRWVACVRRYAAALDKAALSAGRSCWVEKTPNHLLFLDEIETRIPDARIVHVLRRGIDVVASVTDADMQHGTAAFRGGIAQWARRWNHAMALHVARLGDPRHHLLCLEDLVDDPRGEWERLRDFLKLDPGKDLLPKPRYAIADPGTEPWKETSASGVARRMESKAQALFGPRSLAWLRQQLTDYRAIRNLAHERTITPSSRAPGKLLRIAEQRGKTLRG